jgi:hypothetical protein
LILAPMQGFDSTASFRFCAMNRVSLIRCDATLDTAHLSHKRYFDSAVLFAWPTSLGTGGICPKRESASSPHSLAHMQSSSSVTRTRRSKSEKCVVIYTTPQACAQQCTGGSKLETKSGALQHRASLRLLKGMATHEAKR